MIEDLERAASAGYCPGAAASTEDGRKVVVFSHPYTDGHEIFVLGLTKPGNPTSWKEFRFDELALHDDNRTPVVADESQATRRGHAHESRAIWQNSAEHH